MMPPSFLTPNRPTVSALIRLTRLDKPIGILLLLWPTAWALWLAGDGSPNPNIVAIFVAGVVLMRSAGCVINDYADRKIDGRVERTRSRPLAQGEISANAALVVFGTLCAISGILVLFTNRLTVQLAFVALLLASLYPFAKRWTHFPQVILGAAFSMAIPMAFSALTHNVPLLAWGLFGLNLIWVVVYDTFYAMVDREDDRHIGVKSTAVWLGDHDRWVTALLQAIFLCGWVWVGLSQNMSGAFYMGWMIAASLCVWQQHLIRHRRRADCFRAFTNNQWVGCVIFTGIVCDLLIIS